MLGRFGVGDENSWIHIESLESAATATDAIFVPLEDNNSESGREERQGAGGSSGDDTIGESGSRARS